METDRCRMLVSTFASIPCRHLRLAPGFLFASKFVVVLVVVRIFIHA